MSVGGAEARDVTLLEIVGADRSRYPRDKSGAHGSGYGGGDGNGGIRGRERLGYGIMEGGIMK